MREIDYAREVIKSNRKAGKVKSHKVRESRKARRDASIMLRTIVKTGDVSIDVPAPARNTIAWDIS